MKLLIFITNVFWSSRLQLRLTGTPANYGLDEDLFYWNSSSLEIDQISQEANPLKPHHIKLPV